MKSYAYFQGGITSETIRNVADILAANGVSFGRKENETVAFGVLHELIYTMSFNIRGDSLELGELGKFVGKKSVSFQYCVSKEVVIDAQWFLYSIGIEASKTGIVLQAIGHNAFDVELASMIDWDFGKHGKFVGRKWDE